MREARRLQEGIQVEGKFAQQVGKAMIKPVKKSSKDEEVEGEMKRRNTENKLCQGLYKVDLRPMACPKVRC